VLLFLHSIFPCESKVETRVGVRIQGAHRLAPVTISELLIRRSSDPANPLPVKQYIMGEENGVSSIFGPITTLFNYFNESKIELTLFSFFLP